MVTSLDDLKKVKATEEVELPPFVDGTPFVAELRKISFIDMARSGRIPNPILKAALSVSGEKTDEEKKAQEATEKIIADENETFSAFEFISSVAEKSLVSPTYNQIKECGIELTDQQLYAIFAYAFGDLEILSKFC